MKITKFVHACLLIETDQQVILVDPGQFSWESKLFDIQKLNRLDMVIITHEHFDHFYKPFVEAVIAKFPDAAFMTTPAAATQLQEMGVKNVLTDSNEPVEIFSKQPHASLDPIGHAPQNIAVHIADQLTIGGDRHDLEESKNVLALTVTAPWGSMMQAAAMALRLQPNTIIPVHDWHWNEKARAAAYNTLENFFGPRGIAFIKPVDGQPFEVKT